MDNNRDYIMAALNEWLEIDKTSGVGNGEVTLTAMLNEEVKERTARLKIQGLRTNVFVNIKQNHLIPFLSIENGDLTFSSIGGMDTITINSNVLWDIEDGDWYDFDFVEGEQNNKETFLTITVSPNGGGIRETEIPIYLRENHNEILGTISITQMNFDSTVEVPTDVENCFYIEPNITDGRVVDISFAYTGDSNNDGFNFLCDSYIYYYQNQKWNLLKVNPVYEEYGSLQTQKRVYFKQFYRRSTFMFVFLRFDIKGYYNVGGDLTTLLGKVGNPYGYNGLTNDNQRYANELFATTDIVDASNLILPLKNTRFGYQAMFYNCSELIAAPELLAPTLEEDCYYQMFGGCSKLNYIKMLAYETTDWSNLYAWVAGVAPNGTFIKSIDNTTMPSEYIPEGWVVYNTESVEIPEIPDTPDDENSEYFWIKLREDGNIYGLYDLYGHIYFSYDKITWTQASREGYIYGDVNQTIYFKNNDPTWYRDYSSYVSFDVKGKVGGNLASLGRPNTTYKEMFKGNTYLIDASKLVIPTEYMNKRYCYRMFYNCSSLVSAPQLPATVLAEECYWSMFSGCSSLINAPQLPATTLVEDCYYWMFNGCSNLNYIKMLATDVSATNCLRFWVNDVSPTGTFVKAENAVLPTGDSGIPSGWTVEVV